MANDGNSRAHCPICKRWVPAEKMNYDIDEGGVLSRICNFCMEVEEVPEGKTYVLDLHHGEVQCIYCDSYNTKNIRNAKSGWFERDYECLDCGEQFVNHY